MSVGGKSLHFLLGCDGLSFGAYVHAGIMRHSCQRMMQRDGTDRSSQRQKTVASFCMGRELSMRWKPHSLQELRSNKCWGIWMGDAVGALCDTFMLGVRDIIAAAGENSR